MKITVMTADERFVTLEVDPQELVENVKALLEVETQVPLQQQQLLYNGREIKNTDRLSSIGLVEGDLIMMVSTPSRTGANDLSLNPDGSAVNPRAMQQHIRNDSHLMNLLLERDRAFAEAVLGDNLDVFQNTLRQQHQQRLQLERQKQEEIALLNADPFDVEAQKRIEEAIRQKSVDENWEAALEHNPEAFARVVMLYVDMEVNGVPLKAFVDSGAQMTIISRRCAESCGLLRLLDRRYVGVARGVGQSEIVGRIHVAPIKIGTQFYPCSFTVLDSPNLEFIFGLDMLRKHQCQIDLKDNVLHVGGGEVSVPFLQEKDIPAKTEVQCKTFFSKARKRLGLDELIPQESNISAKRNHGRKDDETGLDKICALLWDTDTSAKVGEIPYSNASSEAGPNSKAGIVLNDFCEGHHRSEVEDNQKKSNSGDGKASLKEETELKESANSLQNATEVTSGKAPASPEAQHFWFDRSLMNRREGLHMCSLTETQQKKDNPQVSHADALYPDESITSQVIVESYDKARDFIGDSVEAEDHKPSEAVISCSGKKSFIDELERCHGMVKREVFIDGKAESKRHEEAGSLMEPISSEEGIRLPGNEMREKNPMNVMTSQGNVSAGTLKLVTSEPNENSLDHFSSLNSEILSSDRLVNTTTNGSRAALHASDDVSSKEKCLIGSTITCFGNDPFGMNVTSATRNSKSLVGGKSAGASSTNNVAWKMYLDGKESIRFPVHGQEKMPICTSVVSQFQQKTSDSFSCMPQQMMHYMRPEVISQQNQHMSSPVLSKGNDMFQQTSASSLLVRKRHLNNPMVHHYEIEEECHKIQQQGSSDSELPSQRFRGQLQMLNQTGTHGPNVKVYQQETLPLDSEQSSSLQFEGQQLQMLNHIEVHPHRNVDAYKQEALQQNACDLKLSSQVLAGQQLQVVSQEEICREKEIGTYQRAALQHLAQEHYNSQVKSLQQNQIVQPNSDQHMIQKVQNANEEHCSLVSQILQMSNSEQIMELSNQMKQSSLIPEQKHLRQWQQEYKAHSDICEDYMFPKKTEWQVESHKQLKSQRFENNCNPIMKSIYSSQVPSVPGEIEVKSCPSAVEQTPRRGDVKLFGQNLLSHPSNVSKLPPSKNVTSESIESRKGSCKTFSIQENDEWCLPMATMSSDKQPQTRHSCVRSEDIAASAENTKSGRVHEAVTDIIEHFVHETQESKQNLAKVGAGYLSQDFGGQNFRSWEGSGGHSPCINSMPVHTGTLPLPQDLNLQLKGNSLVGTSIEQTVNAGRCKEICLNSSAIPGVHGRVIQDVPYPIRDPLTIRHADYHPAGRRDLGSSSFPSLDLKLRECSIEFQKRNGVLDMTMASSKPGKCDTVQSMFAFPSQIRNIFNDTGFQMGGVMPGGTVSDPVNAINMLDSPAEQATVSVKYPQFTRTGDLESDRGDYSS